MGLNLDKPQNNIFESSLLGTGGGYGESIVIHLGFDHWIVIDSCINPKTRISIPLEYLEKLGINIQKSVKLILCTHWHDDHIRGISMLLEKCKSAIFSTPRSSDIKKFLRLVGLDHHKSKINPSASSTTEFNKCLDILERRNQTFCRAIEDRTLLSNNQAGFNYTVCSLSPSDYIMSKYDEEISTLITEYGKTNRKIISETPNSKSVALLLKINKLRILLGSDLEFDPDSDQKGWLRVLENSKVIDSESSLYKVPHHGSKNGDHDRIWNELLLKNPISKLTPWNKNRKLPQANMLEKIQQKSEVAFITSINKNSKPKAKLRQRKLNKVIKSMKPSIREIMFHFGQVRCRANINNLNQIWSIELDGTAREIDGSVISLAP